MTAALMETPPSLIGWHNKVGKPVPTSSGTFEAKASLFSTR
jgi:hypothetical protein